MASDLSTLVTRVADHLVERDMENEDWGRGAAVNSLLSTDQEKYVEEARRIIESGRDTD